MNHNELKYQQEKPLNPPPQNINSSAHSLQLALDAEFHFVRSLKDLLQTHNVVGVGVSEGDVVWKAADFDGFRAAADELVGNHHGAVQAQSLTWTWRRATRLEERDESMIQSKVDARTRSRCLTFTSQPLE